MIISIIFLIIVILGYLIYEMYLKEYINVTVIYKSLRKVLESRDLLVLKLLSDIEDKKLSEEVLNLIKERNDKSKISYDDAIRADIKLHNELKKLYEIINKIEKNELQNEIFKKIIQFEKRLKNMRVSYTNAVTKYNLSLTLHPKVCIKIIHMRPLEVYGVKK